MPEVTAKISRSAALRREFLAKKRQLGLLKTLRLALKKILRKLPLSSNRQQVDQFDSTYGTDTSSIVEVGALDMPDDRMQHAVRYQTAIVGVFESMLKELQIDFSQFVFVDIGSGKGRAMLIASRYPFKAIRGVELSRHLHEVAQRNISIYRDPEQHCKDIQSICADATGFELPAESTVFYLFNPFDGVVMKPFVERLEISLLRLPRRMLILYLKPVHRDFFEKSGSFRLLHQTDRYAVFEGQPSAPAST